MKKEIQEAIDKAIKLIALKQSIKHWEEMHSFPGVRGRLVRWLQSVIRSTMSII